MGNRKMFIAALLLGTMLLAGVPTTQAANQQPSNVNVYYAPLSFVVDGKQVAPPEGQRGFIYMDSTYVPLRFLSYSLNKAVGWDGDTYTVTVYEPNAQEKITIEEYNLNRVVRNGSIGKVDTSSLFPTSLEVYFENVTYVFDGESKVPPSELPGLIYQGYLYVPMRFFSEAVSRTIDWDPETYTIAAKTTGVENSQKLPHVKYINYQHANK